MFTKYGCYELGHLGRENKDKSSLKYNKQEDHPEEENQQENLSNNSIFANTKK